MTLRTNHIQPLSTFQKKIIRGFLHLSDSSPIPSLFFLSGELPIEARIHRDVFSLFHIIWSNPQTKIFQIVKYLLENSPENSHTWSRHIRNLAIMYNMEDPLASIQKSPPLKKDYNAYILTQITVYHEKKLRLAASTNSKMTFLNVNLKGLNGRHHPALLGVSTTQGVSKMRAHIKMLCSDLYTYQMKADYQGGSPRCRLGQQPSENNENVENLEHILTECNAYSEVRVRILKSMENLCKESKSGFNLEDIMGNTSHLTQFILDCSSMNLPSRINISDEICGEIFNLSRDLCFHIKKKQD